jgi:hypothetical protein
MVQQIRMLSVMRHRSPLTARWTHGGATVFFFLARERPFSFLFSRSMIGAGIMSRKVGMPYRQQPARPAFFKRAQKLGVRSGRLRTGKKRRSTRKHFATIIYNPQQTSPPEPDPSELCRLALELSIVIGKFGRGRNCLDDIPMFNNQTVINTKQIVIRRGISGT